MKDPRDVIIEPVVSEKSYALLERNVYTFIVHPSANKPEIHDAVESIFNVSVLKVNTLNRKGKRKRNRRPCTFGTRPDTKRAIVTLAGRRPHRAVRELSGARWPFASASPPARDAGSRPSPTSRRSPRPSPRSRCSRPSRSTGGRNSYGRKTARHRGGGHKQQYRVIDFKRNKDGVPGQGRGRSSTTRTATAASLLLHYLDGEKRYILAPDRRRRSATCCRAARAPRSGPATPCRCATSRSAPPCTTSSSSPARGGKMARSAGSSVQLVAKEGDFATLRLPSTEMRRVPIDCRATVGEVGNAEAELIKIGKAGRNRWKGVAPADPRRRHEPRRPPPRRRRGQDLRRPPPGVAVGQARGPHPRQEQAVPEAHRPPSPHPRQRGGRIAMPRSLKKGPFVDDHLLKKVDDLNDQGREAGHQDVVAPLHDHPRHGRPHHRGPRRPQARARVHHRVDGRAQARRVRPDPHVPVPRRPGAEARGRRR